MNLLLNNHETQTQNFLLSTQMLLLSLSRCCALFLTYTHARTHTSLQNELTSADC